MSNFAKNKNDTKREEDIESSSMVSEEFGFVGSFILLIIYAVMIYRIVAIGFQSRNFFGRLFFVSKYILFLENVLQEKFFSELAISKFQISLIFLFENNNFEAV